MIERNTVAEMQRQARSWQRQGLKIGFVPTMGCLHDGHVSLMTRARELADKVVVSIFVNPTQFGPNEDFDRYPRTYEEDHGRCRAAGVDCIFYPTPAEMYPADASTWVEETVLSLPLCGAARPGHFRGVTTIVAKLFLAVLPDVAVFGQKDAQQALILQRMVRDLNFPVEMVIAPTHREPDGLAMSSRNRYLSPAERRAAVAIHRGLSLALQAWESGHRDCHAIAAIAAAEIHASGGIIDYIECRRTQDLSLVNGIADGTVLIAAAVRYGNTRLIDNAILS